MTPISEVFNREDDNLNKIYLYSEGLFYKAYLHSAFMFIRDYGNFKPVKKHIKSSDRLIVSIGFPKSTIEKYFPEDSITTYTDGAISASCNSIDIDMYEKWFEELSIFEKPETGSAVVKTGGRYHSAAPIQTPKPTPLATIIPPPASTSTHEQIILKLRDFRLDNASPIDCMLFVASLQKELDLMTHGNIR